MDDIDWDALKEELQDAMDDEEEMEDFDFLGYGEDSKPFANRSKDDKPEYIQLGKKEEPKEETEEEDLIDRRITDEDVIKNASALYPEKKVYRSLLLEIFTKEQCIEIEKLSRTFSISNNTKVSILKEKLDEWGIKWTPLGPGTNRWAFMTDGYVVKIACDKDGKIDNQREFIYSRPLQPYVIKCYETICDGLMAVFEYVDSFKIDDYWQNQDKMREILEDIATNFLIGDVGVSSVNYVNWAYRDDGSLVILDYAYIYSVKFRTFDCGCRPGAMLHYDKDFNNLICPVCGKKHSFKEIRKRISRKDQDEEIGDVSKKGYILRKPEDELKFNPMFVLGAYDRIMKYLLKKKKKELNKIMYSSKKKKHEEEVEPMELDEILDEIKNKTWRE